MKKKPTVWACILFALFFYNESLSAQSLKSDNNPKITLARALELYKKAPKDDPWKKVPDGSSLSWRESYYLQALVDLYEATGNTKFLKELVSRGDQLLSHRDDRRGVKDGSGKSRPAWSMALKYVVADGKLIDAAKETVISIRSTPSAYNNFTRVEVVPAGNNVANRFSLRVTNDHFKRNELFIDLSMNPEDERYIERIVNDPMAPYSTRSGEYTEKSNLIRVDIINPKSLPISQSIELTPIPLAYMGYMGIIYDPLIRFAEIVKDDPKLIKLVPAADRFIKAAEETYQDASDRLWRNGPNEGEGYYLTCEKGESFPADNVGQPFNFLGKHVCVELALYRLTGKEEYLERSKRMINLFKNRLVYDVDKDLYVWNYWYEPMTTTGWSPKDSLSFNVYYFHPAPYVEDISHGTLDIAMVMAAHRMGIGFDKTDAQRFANTLLRNVISADRTTTSRTVNGLGEYPAYFPALHRWLELSEVDPNVYAVIREIYLNRKEETLGFSANLLKWERRSGKTP